MKKKIMISLAVLAVIGVGLYFYMYKGHREIASEEAHFSVTVAQLQQQFSADPTNANAQYADQTIAVSGLVTAVDESSHLVVIDEKLSVAFKENQTLKPQQRVGVKGRFVGYDDLLEEFKMDQASIVD
ncbi:MAG TPA: hypothetical protein PLS51_09780 [Flavobacterium sp.]|nr:hypothetical protein [Flavobacterium sp.]HPJ10908.1 hypothetical protein [Flavobacterium sp.]